MDGNGRLTLGARWALWWGKARRYFYHSFYPAYIARGHARRRGECLRCGVCCRLGTRCSHLATDERGMSLCLRHAIRPRNCRVFPIDESDLAERDSVSPGTRCGFSFAPERLAECPKDAGAEGRAGP